MVKKDIKEMAEDIGVKPENLEAGLKKDKKHMEDAVIKAHAFMKKKR